MTKWVTKKLGECCEINPHNTTNLPEGFYYIDLESVVSGKLIKNQYFSRKEAPSRAQRIVLNNDILYQTVRPYQKNNYIFKYNNDSYVASTGYALLRAKENIEASYIYYIVHTHEFVSTVLGLCTGTSYPAIAPGLLHKIEIPIPALPDGTPDLSEQRRIAGILSSADGAIAASEALIAKYRNIKRGLLTTLLQPKEGWKKVKFDDFFDFLPTNTLSRDKLNDQYGTYQNIHYGDVLIKYPFCLDCNSNEIPFINEAVNFNKAEIKDGDVVFADTAEDDTVGKCVEILNVGEKKIVAGLHTYLCRPKYKMALGYLGYFLNSDTFHDQLLRYIAGSKVSSVNKTSIKNTYIYYPEDLAEQRRIAEILSSVDAKIAAEEKVVEKYKGVKKGLMEELLKSNE